MNQYSVDNIRKNFINFFESKGHLAAHSFSLIPKNDNTLLLINAGMAPLKRFFTGADTPVNKRMVTCQKCVRTGDIENVGYTSRHCTFFEMLGNFSFGDYFKKEAIEWAWEFLTNQMHINQDQLWVSVYHEDDEAYEIWKNHIHIPEERIVRLGKKDNFWELEVGPSGPCSEIYFDRGPDFGCDDPLCQPGCDCDRFVEIWNLVFTQFDKDASGVYHPLSNPNIDTGMGLERVAAVLQGKKNVFEIEPLISIIQTIEKLSHVTYGRDKKTDISIRIITDHVRAITFLIGDGVVPSNEGRGYVLRRLLRRASRHGKLLGVKESFLVPISLKVIELWQEAYPELKNNKDQIFKVIEIEEEKFNKTIDQGMDILSKYFEELESQGFDTLSGEMAFKLYDTYGFPFELTQEILSEKNFKVSHDEFLSFMQRQKESARNARGVSASQAWSTGDLLIEGVESTLFKGYEADQIEARILRLYDEAYNQQEFIDRQGYVVLDTTILYAESGGQTGDRGYLESKEGHGHVFDVTKANNDIFLHHVKINQGKLSIGDCVTVQVDKKARKMTSANHTATHLLHAALRKILGSHVNQSGSLVELERLRFDFSHFEALKPEEINAVEKMVNEKIFDNISVTIETMSLDEAKSAGITALFDSKYGEKVRVISIGDESQELCGGTHVQNTSGIGLFKIISETGIASGIRRIEAFTGMHALNQMKSFEDKTIHISSLLKTTPENIENRIVQLQKDLKDKDKIIQSYKNELLKTELNELSDEYQAYHDVKIFALNLGDSDINTMRELSDRIKDKHGNTVVVLASENDGKVLLVTSVAPDLIKQGLHAGQIIKEIAAITGGGGGGRPDFAQAGGKNPQKIKEALEKAVEIIKAQIK